VPVSDRVGTLERFTFIWVASLVALTLVAIWIAVLAVPGGILFVVLIPFSFPRVSIILGALGCVAFISLCWLRYCRIVGGILTGVVIAILLSTIPKPALSFSRWAADLAEVAYYHNVLQRLADESRLKGESPPIGVLTLDGFTTLASGLALDPSGEIMLPANQRSGAWNAVGGQTELGVENMDARHIIGNYYAWFHD
jgi:hypothetical protein